MRLGLSSSEHQGGVASVGLKALLVRGRQYPADRGSQRSSIGTAPVAAIAIAAYWILLGGTEAGVIISVIRAANAAIAGVFILVWLRRMPGDNDSIDRIALLGLLGFLAAATLAAYARQALDAATAAIGWAAAFYLARRLAANPRTVRFALNALGIVGLTIAFLFAALWGATWFRWGALTGFAEIPPFRIHLQELTFRHVHVVAFSALALAPAALQLWRIHALRPVVAVGIASTTFVVLASGSRTAWLAVLIASALTAVLYRTRHKPSLPSRKVVLTILFTTAGVIGVFMFTGAATAFLDRLTTLSTIGARGQIWGAALQLWGQHPFSGTGPGSFAVALPASDYFQLNAFPPRHADNAAIQLLAEGGVVATFPIALAGFAIGWRVLQRAPLGAVWAIAVLGLASVMDNPTDSAGLNAVLFSWLAIALPRRAEGVSPLPSRGTSDLLTSGLLVAVVAYVSISAASFAYDAALGRASHGDLRGSRSALALAVTLDPGFALYHRELGLVALAQNEPTSALRHLRIALRESPLDDVTIRALAIAESRSGRGLVASDLARQAAGMRPSVAANLLLAAALPDGSDHIQPSSPYLIATVELDPLLLTSPSWATRRGVADMKAEIIARAAVSAGDDPLTSVQLSFQPAWLAAMAGLDPPQANAQNASSVELRETIAGWTLLMQCRVAEASIRIVAAQATEGDSGLYWFVRATVAAANGTAARDRSLASIASSAIESQLEANPGGISPAFDPAQDRRLYGRRALYGLPGFEAFPTHEEAAHAWLLDPFDAAKKGAPASRLASCR